MSSLATVVQVVVAVVLLVGAGLLARSGRVSPWPAIVVATLASGFCFTIGGDSGREASEPSVATVMAAAAGILTVAAAILALVPRMAAPPFTRVPKYVAIFAIVVSAVGLLVNQLTS